MKRLVLIVVIAIVALSCGEGSREPAATTTIPSAATSTTAAPSTTSTSTPATPAPVPSTTQPRATSSTAAPDTTPPALSVTDPGSGSTVDRQTYRFLGTTEPGCTVVAAGRYPADVDAAGNWSIVLVLNRGGNVATFTSTDEAGNTTEVRHPVYYEPSGTTFDRALYTTSGDVRHPALTLVDPGGGAVDLPLDRRTPRVSFVASDLEGGLVIGTGPGDGAFVRLRSGRSRPEIVATPDADGWSVWPAVVTSDRRPALFYGRHTYATWRDGDVDVLEITTKLMLQPLDGGPPQTLLTHRTTTTFTWPGGYEQHGADLVWASVGGGRLALLWSEGDCDWIEFRDEGAAATLATNPRPEAASCDDGVDFSSAALGRNGRWLVANQWSGPAGRPSVVVYDLVTGAEVARFPGAQGVYDGATSMVVSTIVDGRTTSSALVSWTDAGTVGRESLDHLARPPEAWGGIVGDRIHIAPDTALAPMVWNTCSAAGARGAVEPQPGLPPAVDATRRAIATAAASCDLMALDDLALANPSFTIGVTPESVPCDEPGPPEPIRTVDPVPLWHGGDRAHDEMALMLRILDEPFTVEDGAAGPLFAWPADGYAGYRIVIDAEGRWSSITRGFPLEPCETIWCTC
jgi:hypothetical protein